MVARVGEAMNEEMVLERKGEDKKDEEKEESRRVLVLRERGLLVS